MNDNDRAELEDHIRRHIFMRTGQLKILGGGGITVAGAFPSYVVSRQEARRVTAQPKPTPTLHAFQPYIDKRGSVRITPGVLRAAPFGTDNVEVFFNSKSLFDPGVDPIDLLPSGGYICIERPWTVSITHTTDPDGELIPDITMDWTGPPEIKHEALGTNVDGTILTHTWKNNPTTGSVYLDALSPATGHVRFGLHIYNSKGTFTSVAYGTVAQNVTDPDSPDAGAIYNSVGDDANIYLNLYSSHPAIVPPITYRDTYIRTHNVGV